MDLLNILYLNIKCYFQRFCITFIDRAKVKGSVLPIGSARRLQFFIFFRVALTVITFSRLCCIDKNRLLSFCKDFHFRVYAHFDYLFF